MSDALKLEEEIDAAIDEIMKRYKAYSRHAGLMRELISAGEARRLGRVGDIGLANLTYKNGQINATTIGSRGTKYNTRITMGSKRGHHCTCPDWQRRGASVGPCKHVLALAEYWQKKRIEPKLAKIRDALKSAL